MQVEALAWFDHWLKGRDTGILDGRASVTGCPGPQCAPETDFRHVSLASIGP
jgi:uncharacterized protein